MEAPDISESKPLINSTEENNTLPNNNQFKVKHRIFPTALLTVLISSILFLGIGVGYLLPVSPNVMPETVNSNTNKINQTVIVFPTVTIISSPTPTVLETATPSKSPKVSFPNSNATQLPISTYNGEPISILTINHKPDFKIEELVENEFIVGYSLSNPTNANLYKLQIRSALPDYNQVTFNNLTDIGLTKTRNAYRAISNDTLKTWVYATDVTQTGDCGSDSENHAIEAPCGAELFQFINNEPLDLDIHCEAKTNEGFAICDDIVKSLEVKSIKQ